ncbi:murein L,D-transpeptidase [Mesorhizobium sp. M2D.F.Ca.ET.185.01.1.1]|uniref:L,D-transpeptidase family protein n=1 Tax=unclassified Mesorhizobium TaxID=325217 RepID=UPI000FCA24CF|nr:MULTISPECIES: murein L,D-transpeptidase family protein [unclassified Mesorhizobium]TGP83302.1 murein L,D-transpeptidase [bacterium M00.F.Ca.ET.227.01.1.1]TGP99257.1 murein L,D-transpeptidase [bacterium M00.F.Ca.ET.221.01.1.1]TGP99987.1 murein L,D-transpeptidase [bacterium M00.F.Ca.ET.222.01.1.1]TGU11373.1 murein L,D-transpeptidase [bacterium M00.F.Ca.ET.163.01.1.1]TGU34969.1 murein L,D-transpeptidase [bacterium M00.F.Ca.ET.156.01.1.1]TGU51318.1 murein L,D-transpeptidase [bacterium M00.F.Ca
MFAKLARTGVLIAAVGVAGCNDSSMKDFAPEANKPLPDKILADMQAKGMVRTSSVMARIFKEEGKLEIWKAKTNGRYDLVASYDICKWSGKLGPKYTEGDRQAPEGFYTVRPSQMNPRSNYHLSFNIGFPNAYDRANGRTGQNLMVHGACSSSGCYSMTDAQIEQIYAFGRDAFQGGQTEFQIQAFPFRMTAANMARYRNDPNYEFWKMLKVGYDNFEITKVPPKVDVCEKRYVFNQVAPEGTTFNPTGPCPETTQPDSLKTAYANYEKSYDAAFKSAVNSSSVAPKPTIAGIKEASIVSDWSKRRARGERVPIEPPSMNPDGSVTETTRMGRIDSPAGRKMAALDAEKEAKRKAEEQRLAAIEAAKAAKEQAKAQALAEKEAAKQAAQQPVVTAGVEAAPAQETQQAADADQGTVSKLKRKLLGMFGG